MLILLAIIIVHWVKSKHGTVQQCCNTREYVRPACSFPVQHLDEVRRGYAIEFRSLFDGCLSKFGIERVADRYWVSEVVHGFWKIASHNGKRLGMKLNEITIEGILHFLDACWPRILKNSSDFNIDASNKQKLLNILLEMKQRDLISAKFLISNLRNNYGTPLDVAKISITKEGRLFMEKKKEPVFVTQTFNISNSPGVFSVSATGNSSVDLNIEAEKIVSILIDNIEKSDIDEPKKRQLIDAIKDVVARYSPSMLASLIVESVRGFLGKS